MCARKNNRWNRFACFHKLPQETCDHYAHALGMCTADPNKHDAIDYETLVFDGRLMRAVCRFCAEGRDINPGGAWSTARGGRTPTGSGRRSRLLVAFGSVAGVCFAIVVLVGVIDWL